jgi:hypothetical protein
MKLNEVLALFDETEPDCRYCRFLDVCPSTHQCVYDDICWFLYRVPDDTPEKPR